MERAITRITLDVQKIDSGVQIKAKRGDSARRLVVSLTNRCSPYAPGVGVTAVYYSRKADGVKLFNSAQIDGSTVTYDFTGQTANVEGIAECEIRLYDEEMNLLTSPRFEMLVDGTVYREGDVPDSSPEYTALTELVAQGTELIQDLTNIKDGLEPIRDAAVAAAARAEEAAGTAAASASETRAQASAASGAAASAKDSASKAQQSQTAASGSAQAAKDAQASAEAASADAGEAAVAAGLSARQSEQAALAAGNAAKEALGNISASIGQHDTSSQAHQDIRLELQKLIGHVTTLLDSDDTTLDQMSEIVAYIKNNRTLIDAVTTAKVSVADIVNDLVTNVSHRPLSAAQGVELKRMFEYLASRISITQHDAGELVCVSDDGDLEGLGIGEGLEVADGRLTATGRWPQISSEFDGKLLFVSGGVVTPLKLGPGLSIRDGVLYVSGGSGEPDEPEEPLGVVEASVDGDDILHVYLDGTEVFLEVDAEGYGYWPGLTASLDDEGYLIIERSDNA